MRRYSAIFGLTCILAVFLAIWAGASGIIGAGNLPSPFAALHAFAASAFQDPLIEAQGGGAGGYWPHAVFTFANTLLGVLLGGALGVFVSLFAAQSRIGLLFYDSLVEIARVLPPLVFIPFVILIVNSSNSMELLTVALYSCLSMSVYTIGALAALPPEYNHMATLLGASRTRRIFTVQWPGIAASLVGPLRVNAALGAGICVVAEFLAAPRGIGRVMHFALSFYRIDLILAGVLWTVLSVLIVEIAISVGFRRIVAGNL